MKKIIDKYTKKKLSRQRKHQLRKRDRGVCMTCTNPVGETSPWCDDHAEKHRVYNRLKMRIKLGVKNPRIVENPEGSGSQHGE